MEIQSDLLDFDNPEFLDGMIGPKCYDNVRDVQELDTSPRIIPLRIIPHL